MDDIQIVKKELEKLFKAFLENPASKILHQKAMDLEKEYAGLTTINDYTGKNVVPKKLITAISFLQRIYQYGEKIYDDQKTIEEIKEFIKNEINK